MATLATSSTHLFTFCSLCVLCVFWMSCCCLHADKGSSRSKPASNCVPNLQSSVSVYIELVCTDLCPAGVDVLGNYWVVSVGAGRNYGHHCRSMGRVRHLSRLMEWAIWYVTFQVRTVHK